MHTHELSHLSTITPLSVALYARVSSEQQKEHDLSIPAQLKALRQHASKQGWTIVGEYVDEAITGRTDQRPAFQEMIALAKRKDHPIQVVLCWKFDRFARNREQSVIYKAVLRRHQVQVLSLNEPLEDSPAGRLSEGMLESIAQFISENMGSDIFRGQRENANRGFFNGGSPPYGYQLETILVNGVPRKRLMIDPATAPIVRKIYDLALAGKGGHAIARQFTNEGLLYPAAPHAKHAVWTFYVIYRILKNPVYTGTLVWGRRHLPVDGVVLKHPDHTWIRKTDAHPAIVSEAEYQQIQQRFASRSPATVHPRTLHGRYLLTGLLRCAQCYAPMYGLKGGKAPHRYYYYTCSTFWRKGKHLCASSHVRSDVLDATILDSLQAFATEEQILKTIVIAANRQAHVEAKSTSGKLGQLDRQIIDIDDRLTRLYAALETGTLSIADLAPRIRTLQTQRKEREQQRAALQREAPVSVPLLNFEQIQANLQHLVSLFASKPREEQKAALRTVIAQVLVGREEGGAGVSVEIQYTLGNVIRRLLIQRGKADRGENGQYIRAVQ